jgi:hypothetical protein
MLKHITLNLAREPDFPEGSAECGYDIVAPLDAAGHLDSEGWHKAKAQCRVRRFWVGEDDRSGLLVHQAGGAHGATWRIDYESKQGEEEESGYRLDSHQFVANEYVSIRDASGHPHTFKIKEIHPA